MSANLKLSHELMSFKHLWKGGYFEGDPLTPLGRSSYGQLNYISVLHATYLRCIKPYIDSASVVLEIGPGKGAWTKCMLSAKEVWALDALPEANNGFYQYLGNPANVKYFHVNDFECSMLPERYFSYMFSFGCLCHVSFAGITAYAKNIYPKLQDGAECFWLVADYSKLNDARSNPDRYSIWYNLPRGTPNLVPLRWVFKLFGFMNKFARLEDDLTDEPFPGRWYDAGVERTCAMLSNVGYEVVDRDVGTLLRDPIVHFRKPRTPENSKK
jgi:hypothetical protein